MIQPNAAPRPAADAAFFALEDTGILFSETHQDLHLLDAAACFVWCSLQDGEPVDEIISGYAEAREISSARAERIVGGLLHRWSGLGYLEGDGPPPPHRIDLVTALGRLLVNPALRRSFAAAPEETARRLGLSAGDRDAFLSLNVAQLERQANAVTEHRDRLRRTKPLFDHEATRSLGDRILSARGAAATVGRRYRLCGTGFHLYFETAAQEAAVRSSLLHMETVDEARPDFILYVVEARHGHAVLRDGDLVGCCDRLDQLARVLVVLVRDLVLVRTDYFLMLHAGVVSAGEACVLLPAAPGSGKSTLTAALAQSGFRYFTDEIAILQEGDLHARPFPVPIVVKEGSVGPLRPYYPGLPALPVCRRDNDQPVRYLPPPLDEAFAADTGAASPVRWIVFPRYEATSETTLQPLRTPDALVRLMAECKVVTADLNQANVAALVGWLRQVDCYDLTMSSLSAAVPLMRRLCFSPGLIGR